MIPAISILSTYIETSNCNINKYCDMITLAIPESLFSIWKKKLHCNFKHKKINQDFLLARTPPPRSFLNLKHSCLYLIRFNTEQVSERPSFQLGYGISLQAILCNGWIFWNLNINSVSEILNHCVVGGLHLLLELVYISLWKVCSGCEFPLAWLGVEGKGKDRLIKREEWRGTDWWREKKGDKEDW